MPADFVTTSVTGKGPNAGVLTQPESGKIYGSYLYWKGDSTGGIWAGENSSVHLGAEAGHYYQDPNAVALGAYAGQSSQGLSSIAIGANAGQIVQGNYSVAIGSNAGKNNQQVSSVAIGEFSGFSNQGNQSIAIGQASGYESQGNQSIAIGRTSGQTNQSSYSIAIGQSAGAYAQGINSIAIGQNAGAYAQGNNSIAIGYNAGTTSQISNSIVLNCSSTPLNPATTGLFVSSIRGPRSSSNVLSYDTATNEIFYNGSSERYKYDIEPLDKDTSAIYKLQPREFKYKSSGETDIGLIAEEAFKCDPSFAYLDKDQLPEGIRWNVITTYLISEFKKLKLELDELEKMSLTTTTSI